MNSSTVPHGYNVHRAEDRTAMLQSIGVSSLDELLSSVPEPLRVKGLLNLPLPLPEWELEKLLRQRAASNSTTLTHLSYLGGGFYEHYIPAVVDAIASRGEFLTAYTPYQPEMSQGILQVLYEYQKTMGLLLGVDSVNCSCYDGATALAEGAWMGVVASGGICTVAVADTIWPSYLEVLKTYLHGRGVEVIVVPSKANGGLLTEAILTDLFSARDIGTFVFQSPNAFGLIEDYAVVADCCASHQVISNLSWNPLLSALLDAPGQRGIDIVHAEGQPLGIPLSAGGPSLGVIGTKPQFRHLLPGRLVGVVPDLLGNHAFSLVEDYREQHVAREHATSNICSNQALNALRSVVYLSAVGEGGFKNIASRAMKNAHYLVEALTSIPGGIDYHARAFLERIYDYSVDKDSRVSGAIA